MKRILLLLPFLVALCACNRKATFDRYCENFRKASAAYATMPPNEVYRSRLAGAAAAATRAFGQVGRALEAVRTTNPRAAAAILDRAARDEGTTFDCPEFREWDAWMQPYAQGQDRAEARESLQRFCAVFDEGFGSEVPPERRGLAIAQESSRRTGSTATYALIESLPNKQPAQQLSVLEELARGAGTTFECPSFRAWAAGSAAPDAGAAAPPEKR